MVTSDYRLVIKDPEKNNEDEDDYSITSIPYIVGKYLLQELIY